ncbi:hypothetical protein MMPV_007197 [Pyropia vietnamensis]
MHGTGRCALAFPPLVAQRAAATAVRRLAVGHGTGPPTTAAAPAIRTDAGTAAASSSAAAATANGGVGKGGRGGGRVAAGRDGAGGDMTRRSLRYAAASSISGAARQAGEPLQRPSLLLRSATNDAAGTVGRPPAAAAASAAAAETSAAVAVAGTAANVGATTRSGRRREEAASDYRGMELTFLGTSATVPTTLRAAPALALRVGDAATRTRAAVWLFDAGDGTQTQLMRSHLSDHALDRIFITHLHGDHVLGLPAVVISALQSRSGGVGAREEGEAAFRRGSDVAAAAAPTGRVTDSGGGGHIMVGDSRPSKPAPPSGVLHVYGPRGVAAFLRNALATTAVRLSSPPRLVIHELVVPLSEEWMPAATRTVWTTPTPALQWEAPGSGSFVFPTPPGDAEAGGLVSPPWPSPLSPPPRANPVAAATPCAPLSAPPTPQAIPPPSGPVFDVVTDDPRAVVRAVPVSHAVPTLAYVITERPSTAPRFDIPRVRSLLGTPSIPPGAFRTWRDGGCVSGSGGRRLWLADVTAPPPPVRKVVVVGDTCDATSVEAAAAGCDVLVHEATFEGRLAGMAAKKYHSTSVQAGAMARRVGAKYVVALALTHFSSRYSSNEAIAGLVAEAAAAYGSPAVHGAWDLSVLQVHPPKPEQPPPESLADNRDGHRGGKVGKVSKAGRGGGNGNGGTSSGGGGLDEPRLSKAERRRRARARAEVERAALVGSDRDGSDDSQGGSARFAVSLTGWTARMRQLWTTWVAGGGGRGDSGEGGSSGRGGPGDNPPRRRNAGEDVPAGKNRKKGGGS